ncbi:LysR family transcriptional regulator [Pseudonocardiaceae bacterium YIM PH 21723]|nr:LysR family transcriptional regulator [Pseudonocardiaceae bacterium YIM PH 21723]
MLDPVLLKTFLTVAEAGGFSEAARRLGLGQSTVSQHVRRLESAVGRTLFARDTHSVQLTGDGEAMTGFARNLLDQQEAALRYFSRPELRGKVRLGASEDLVLGALPEILRLFREQHPLVDLELTVELSAVLDEQLEAGKLDLVFNKALGGTGLLTDPLTWVAAPRWTLPPDEPVPLVVYPEPSHTRSRALSVLQAAGRQWRVACVCDRLNGLRAAVLAGLGVAVFAESVVPDGLARIAEHDLLPPLGTVTFDLRSRRPDPTGPVAALAEAVRNSYC